VFVTTGEEKTLSISACIALMDAMVVHEWLVFFSGELHFPIPEKEVLHFLAVPFR